MAMKKSIGRTLAQIDVVANTSVRIHEDFFNSHRIYQHPLAGFDLGPATRVNSEFIHENEVALHNVSVIASFTHPTSVRVAVSNFPSVYVAFAQIAMLVAPSTGYQPHLRVRRQSLVARGIVPTVTYPVLRKFEL